MYPLRARTVFVGLLLVAAMNVHSGADERLKITLLGTGTPTPEADRAGSSILVEAAGLTLLVDAGRGTVVRLSQAGIGLSQIDAVFLTHLHSDHVVGLPDLLLTARLPAHYGRRQRPLALFGPTGTSGMARGIEAAFAADVRAREKSQGLAPESATFLVTEIANAGVVFERSGVRVTAFEVDHGADLKPSFGYRLDYSGRSAVISGDTTFDERVIAAATGADLLIHEVVNIPEAYVDKFPGMRTAIAMHTTPQQAGVIFSRVRPKFAVLTHLALIGGSTLPELVAATRQTYGGPLVVGEDLMTFEIGDAIALYQRAAQRGTP